jgi:hypothetical protein
VKFTGVDLKFHYYFRDQQPMELIMLMEIRRVGFLVQLLSLASLSHVYLLIFASN